MIPQQKKVAVTFTDGEPLTVILGWLEVGRSPTLPQGAVRTKDPERPVDQWYRPVSYDALLAECAKAFPGRTMLRYRIIADDQEPDVKFCAALIDDGQTLAHDMDKARELHREQLRLQRAPILDQLDRDYSRAVGQNRGAKELDDIEANRQKLRDAPADPRIDAAQNIDELKAITLPQ